MNLLKEQLLLEEEMFNGGVQRYRRNIERNESRSVSETAYSRRLMKELISPLADGIQAFKDYYSSSRGAPARALPYLRCVPNEVAAFIALKVTLDNVFLNNTLTDVAIRIGERIEDQIRFTKLEGMASKYFAKVQDSLKKSSTTSYKHKHRVMVSAEKSIVSRDETNTLERWQSFPKGDLGLIGLQLLDIVEKTLHFDGVPIFSRVLVSMGKQQKAILKASDNIIQWIYEINQSLEQLSPDIAPCVIKPLDWTTPFDGGFHTEAIRAQTRLVKGKKSHVKRLTRKQMPLVYEGINALQSVAWSINKDILKVATDVVAKDLGYGVPIFSKIIDKDTRPPCPIPAQYNELRGKNLRSVLTEAEWSSFLEWKSECTKLYTDETKRNSRAMQIVRLLGQARRYEKYDELFFVYTMDSRGRVYARSSILNPQSNDFGKAMLRAAHGQPLNDLGYKQFCITGANLFGWDKEEIEIKIDNVNTSSFIETCKDIKADPLTFRDWLDADEPWEFLAWALEFATYHELKEEGRQSEFLTYLPNGRDGSCSGIQHYSAMMHDEVGGESVNLIPNKKHQDIYKRVAERVNDKLRGIIDGSYSLEFKHKTTNHEVDIDELPEIEDKINKERVELIARAWLNIGVTRDTSKKPVMTLPYGSSQMTCRDSIEEYLSSLVDAEANRARLSNRNVNPVHPFGDNSSELPIRTALSVLTKLLWESITEVVKAPVVAMRFIKKLALAVSKRNACLEWTTPLGFIVKQEIFTKENTRVYTKLMGMSSFSYSEETDVIDKYAMMGAAAPNFVHSMDATHLLASVVAMKRAGITFIHVIHDDFGTLANQTGTLQYILRDEMIKMYKDSNVLEDLLLENELRLGFDSELEAPKQYDLDLEVLRDSEHAFG